jgi:hypothetical protein
MLGTVAYVRRQAVGAGVVNVVVNPALEWVLNRTRGFQPFFGANGVAANLAVTSIILSVLVTLFAARAVRRALAAGQITGRSAPRWLALLPRRSGWLGALAGLAAATTVVVVLWLLDRGGVTGLTFPGLLAVKAGYCGVLAYVVARLAMCRVLASGDAAGRV